MDNLYEQIKSTLSMTEVVQHYGFEANRQHCIVCPFHNEKTASLRLYDKSFYCFGCGAGGDVIKFVSLLFEISNGAAAVRLNEDFRLNLTNRKSSRKSYNDFQRRKAEENRELLTYRAEYKAKNNEFSSLWQDLKTASKPKNMDEAVLLAKKQARIEYLEYWFEENHWR